MGTPAPRPRSRGGLTLLELLLAVTLLVIVATMILTVFHSATTSMKRSRTDVELMQRARFALDAMETDLLNVHYRDETSYNIYMSGILNQFEMMRLEAEQSGDYTQFELTYGDETHGKSTQEGNSTHIGNPYDKGRLIDLGFTGGVSGGTGTISFARRSPRGRGGIEFPMGLSRVTYSIGGGNLVRSEDFVTVPKMDIYGGIVEEREPAGEEPVAEGVASLDLRFAFWYNNQWYETRTWNSSDRLIRSASYRLTTDRDSRKRTSFASAGEGESLQPGDPGWNEFLNAQQNQPFDALPAYVRVRLALLRDPSRPDGPKRVFQRIIRVPTSQETYYPDGGMDPKTVERETEERDQVYTPIKPGVMMLERR